MLFTYNVYLMTKIALKKIGLRNEDLVYKKNFTGYRVIHQDNFNSWLI